MAYLSTAVIFCSDAVRYRVREVYVLYIINEFLHIFDYKRYVYFRQFVSSWQILANPGEKAQEGR